MSSTSSNQQIVQQPASNQGSMWRRTAAASPLLLISVIAAFLLNSGPVIDAAKAYRDGGVVTLADGESVPFLTSFSGIKWLDQLVALLNVFFMPSLYGIDLASRSQVICFLTDAGVICTIMAIESMRNAYAKSYAKSILRFQFLFGIAAQIIGGGVILPIYFFLHYLLTPTSTMTVPGARLLRPGTALGLPFLAIVYMIPIRSAYLLSGLENRQKWLFVWQLFPIWSAIICWVSRLSTRVPLWHHVTIRNAMITVMSLSAWTWACTVYDYSSLKIPLPSARTIVDIFVPAMAPSQALRTASATGSQDPLTAFTSEFLRVDEVAVFIAALWWLALLRADASPSMSPRGRAFWILGYALFVSMCMAFAGPGATVGIVWLARERMLARRSAHQVQRGPML